MAISVRRVVMASAMPALSMENPKIGKPPPRRRQFAVLGSTTIAERGNGRNDSALALLRTGLPLRAAGLQAAVMARSIFRLAAALYLSLPGALPAEPGAAPAASVAGVDTASEPLAVGDDDEFRRAMLEWAPPTSAASLPTTLSEGFVRLAAPLDRMRPSSMFGVRIDPIDGQWRRHAGMDIPDQAGAPIHAAAEGVVVHAGWAGGYGNLIVIRHADGMETRYGHLSRLLAGAGQMVRQGQVIGLVGETGRATGSHLHFEVRSLGRPVDPEAVLDKGVPAGPVAVRLAGDPPAPVVAKGTGWRNDPDRLPSPAF